MLFKIKEYKTYYDSLNIDINKSNFELLHEQRFSLNITFSVMIITTPTPVGQEMGWVRCQRSTLTPSYNFLSSPFQLRHLQFNVVILIIISFALYPFLTPLFPLEHHFFDHCLGILQVTLPFCLAQNIIREGVDKIGILSKNIISICCSSWLIFNFKLHKAFA